MNDGRKKRLSMLDQLTQAGTPGAAASMMATNRALRSARDAVDTHRVWDIDAAQVIDDRTTDRLDTGALEELRASIAAHGQSVPILVRRDPDDPERYRLVYGARRLAAIQGIDPRPKVRALIATMDDDAALRAQVSENSARRDLSFIERALFACRLLDGAFGTQQQVAEVLNIGKSAVSMAVSVARAIGPDLVMAIGPAPGVGRPRWEALAQDIQASGADIAALVTLARQTREDGGGGDAASVRAFDKVARAARVPRPETPAESRPLMLNGVAAGSVQRTAKGVKLDLTLSDSGFAAWLEAEAEPLLTTLYARWKQQS